MTSPAIIAAVASVITIIVTKLADSLVAKWKIRDDFRHSDRELLSKDEQDFRLTIIKQLQQCHDDNARKDVLIADQQKELIELRKQVATLEIEMARLKNQVSFAVESSKAVVNQEADHLLDTLTKATDNTQNKRAR